MDYKREIDFVIFYQINLLQATLSEETESHICFTMLKA